MIYRVSSAHEEGGERVYAVSHAGVHWPDEAGRVRALRLVEVEPDGAGFAPVPGTERELRCDLVLLAMGFTGAERGPLLDGPRHRPRRARQRGARRRVRHLGARRLRGRVTWAAASR